MKEREREITRRRITCLILSLSFERQRITCSLEIINLARFYNLIKLLNVFSSNLCMYVREIYEGTTDVNQPADSIRKPISSLFSFPIGLKLNVCGSVLMK